MRAETQSLVDEIKQAISLLRRHLDWEKAQTRLIFLNEQAEDPDLWNDSDNAQKLMRERQHLETSISSINGLETEMNDSVELIEMGEEEGDDDIIAEAESTIRKLHKTLGIELVIQALQVPAQL